LAVLRSCRQAIAITRKSFVAARRRDLLLSYLRIELGNARGHASVTRLRQRLAGFEVTFLSYRALRKLFDEIFIEEEYCFIADSAQPFIIDCGSNIGLSILYFKKLYPGARIIGFEPFPTAFDVLTTNIAANRLTCVSVYNLAVARQQGSQTFYYDPSDLGSLRMSLCADRLKGDPIMVKTTRLSSYITGPVDLLKMDIEGAEPEVLDELNESGALVHVKALFLEYHHHIDSRLDSLSVILDILERNNFGYLIRGGFRSPPRTGKFQDLMIYAYAK
jgi:FkbM family methyltransferase